MEVLKNDRGWLLVDLGGDHSEMVSTEPREYRPGAPEWTLYAPEWMLCPATDVVLRGKIPAVPGCGGNYRAWDSPEINDLYGFTVVNVDAIDYHGLPRWVNVIDWAEDSTGLYMVGTTRQGVRVYCEKPLFEILESVLLDLTGRVPIAPAWKSGELVARLVPHCPLEKEVVDPPHNDPSWYVEVEEDVDPIVPGRKVRNVLPREGVRFEEFLSAGMNLDRADAAVVYDPPFSFGVLYKCPEACTTFRVSAMGLPDKWVKKVVRWYKMLEKVGARGRYLLPLGDFVALGACYTGREKLLPSAWTVILDLAFTAPAAAVFDHYVRSTLFTMRPDTGQRA